jgi:hypothetical protein
VDKDKLDWALKRLDAKYPGESDTKKAVTALLSVWVRIPREQQKSLDRDAALKDFVDLVDGTDIIEEVPENNRVWGPASQYHTYSQNARVRTDYDTSSQGWKFNGREGVIIAVRRGSMIIEFSDALSGAPAELRDVPSSFEVDITHLVDRSKQ